MYSTTYALKSTISIPDAHDLSPDLLQVHMRVLLKLLNSFAHKLLVCIICSRSIYLFIFNKIGFFEREKEEGGMP